MALSVAQPSSAAHGPGASSPPHWRESERAEVLDEVRDPDVNVTVWHRKLPADVSGYALRLVELDLKMPLHGGPAPALDGSDIAAQLPAGTGREAFCADVAAAIHRFAALARNWDFKASLDTVCNDKCRRFHVDYYRLRWVSTYVGPGTEWLADDDVDETVLSRKVKDPMAFNAAVAVDARRVRRLGEGDVLVMKGRGTTDPMVGFGGPLHRSPPVLAEGKRRLVLTLTR